MEKKIKLAFSNFDSYRQKARERNHEVLESPRSQNGSGHSSPSINSGQSSPSLFSRNSSPSPKTPRSSPNPRHNKSRMSPSFGQKYLQRIGSDELEPIIEDVQKSLRVEDSEELSVFKLDPDNVWNKNKEEIVTMVQSFKPIPEDKKSHSTENITIKPKNINIDYDSFSEDTESEEIEELQKYNDESEYESDGQKYSGRRTKSPSKWKICSN